MQRKHSLCHVGATNIFLLRHNLEKENSLFVPYRKLGTRKMTANTNDCGLGYMFWTFLQLQNIFSSPEPKAQVSYCHRAPSVVRPSVVVCKLSHFQLLLQNRLMDFDKTWYAWSTHGPLQVLLFFGQIRPGVDPGRGKNRSRGPPFSKNFFFRPEDYSEEPNA